jgi:hypothetical protein
MKKGKPTGCPNCAGKEITTAEFIKRSKERFPDDTWIYSNCEYKDMRTAVILTCPSNHRSYIVPGIHLRPQSKGGCEECRRNATSERNSYTETEWISLAKTVHNNFYSYTKTVYKGSNEKVIITCPYDGDFLQIPTSHISGCGCSKCGVRAAAEAKKYTEDDSVKIFADAKILHDSEYEYTRLYRDDGRLMIEMKCQTHGIISQRLDHHIHGHGCNFCTRRYSKQQIEWLEYCRVSSPAIVHAKNSGEYDIPETRYSVDGFDALSNTVYEYHGDFWHGNPNVFPDATAINPKTKTSFGFLYNRTQIKIEKIKSLKYNVVEVWESDWLRGKAAVLALQMIWRSR